MTSSPFARPLDRVDEQLATLVALQHDTAEQLDHVRKQITDAQTHELNLLRTYAGREERIDSLLDERLLAAQVTT